MPLIWSNHTASSVQFNSVAQSCPTLCDPMNCSTPGLPVHHQLPEFTQTHVHWVGDAIQPSHPLSSPFPPALKSLQSESLKHWSWFLRSPHPLHFQSAGLSRCLHQYLPLCSRSCPRLVKHEDPFWCGSWSYAGFKARLSCRMKGISRCVAPDSGQS